MHCFGNPAALPAEKDRVLTRESKRVQRDVAGGCHQDQPRSASAAGEKSPPRGMTADHETRSVIEACAPQPPIVEQEAARFDQIDLDAEASRKPHQAPGILRYVRLEQSEMQAASKAGARISANIVLPMLSILVFSIYAAVCHIVRCPQQYSLRPGRCRIDRRAIEL